MNADAGWSESASRPANRPLQDFYPRSSAFIRGKMLLPWAATRQASPSAIVNARGSKPQRPGQMTVLNLPELIP
jgi:hypothetical protein